MIEHPGPVAWARLYVGRMRTFSISRILVAATLLALVAGRSTAQDKKDKPDPAQQEEIRSLVVAVDDQMAGKPSASTLPIKWGLQHFVKAQGDKTYVPFVITVDAGNTAALPIGVYLRVAKRGDVGTAPAPPVEPKKKGAVPGESHRFVFEDMYFIDLPAPVAGKPVVLRRAFAVDPGDYDVYVAVKVKAPAAAGTAATAGAATTAAATPAPAAPATAAPAGATPAAEVRIGSLKQEVTVPSMGGDLTTSSIIVADKVDVLTAAIAPDHQADNPYTFGQMKLTPALTAAFAPKDDLNVIFWIYNASPDPATKKPNVLVEFGFSRKTGTGETYFNKTDPQEMNAATLPPQFDLAAGHQLPGSLQVPLASFPEGDYHLQIKVTDKVSGKTLSRDVMFAVAKPAAAQ